MRGENLAVPRRTASLSAQLVDSLRAHIAGGAWPVGTRIPPEHTLVEQLGVGRTTLREALGALVHLGLLEARVGDGTYVRATDELQSVLERRAGAARRAEVHELRAVLEEYASGAAASRRTEKDLAELRQLLAEADDAHRSGDMAQVADVDGRFHRAVVHASGNALLTEVYEYLGNALTTALDGQTMTEETVAGHTRLHGRLVAAIEAGDAARARRAAAAIVHFTQDNDR
ncbi:FadR/GntR family transcriptional regulator [Kutzneria sp. CA-103260]|uniref:FadR/GntR family transcriptional regulator n=1 Tax=Kutzneria sp. CA-103260 TaxID=2802641 RepID=UPI001BA70B39|nr:FCD domain-containing protein [Kutzneria sp. CA-103260]